MCKLPPSITMRSKSKQTIKGYCRICSTLSDLTEDHIIPKGCIGIKKRELHALTNYLNMSKSKPKQYQSGLKFKTLCPDCNNRLLGNEYDPYLIEFSRQVRDVLRLKDIHNFIIPPQTKIIGKPQRIARSIIGHILASVSPNEMGKNNFGPYINSMREYFLDQSLSLPDRIDIFYWLYPSDVQIIIPYGGLSSRKYKECIVYSLLKFFPFAFIIVWEKLRNIKLIEESLLPQKDIGIDEESFLTIKFNSIPRLDWPEIPNSDEFCLINQDESYVAVKHNRI